MPPFIRDRCFKRHPLFLLLFIAPAVLADQDTSLRLNQSIEYRANQQERELLKDELPSDGSAPPLTIDGQAYRVDDNLDELGRAVYLSIERQQWPRVHAYLLRYDALRMARKAQAANREVCHAQ